MLRINKARKAALATFKTALAQGATKELAAQVAFVKYRGYFPTASDSEARQVLVNALAADRVLTKRPSRAA